MKDKSREKKQDARYDERREDAVTNKRTSSVDPNRGNSEPMEPLADPDSLRFEESGLAQTQQTQLPKQEGKNRNPRDKMRDIYERNIDPRARNENEKTHDPHMSDIHELAEENYDVPPDQRRAGEHRESRKAAKAGEETDYH